MAQTTEYIVKEKNLTSPSNSGIKIGANLQNHLLNLPESSTIYLDLCNVKEIDYINAHQIIQPSCFTFGRTQLGGRHLIIVNTSSLILETIEEAANFLKTVFLSLNGKDILNIHGNSFKKSHEKILSILSKANKGITKTELARLLKMNEFTCMAHLKKLFNWGFITRQHNKVGEKSKTGRKQYLYFQYISGQTEDIILARN